MGASKGKKGPSVWPVYLAAGVIAVASVLALIWAFWCSDVREATLGLLGLPAAMGMVRLRPWGWWCAVAWTIIFALLLGVPLLLSVPSVLSGSARIGMAVVVRNYLVMWGGSTGVIVWSLVTRRRLFFAHG